MQKARFQDLCIGVLVTVIGVGAFILTNTMSPDAKLYTRVVTGLFAALGGILVVYTLIKRNVPSPMGEADFTKANAVMVMLLLIIAYVILINVLGFFVSSTLYMLASMVYMGARKAKGMVITVFFMLIFIYFLFVMQLKVPLPHGLLI